MKENVVTHKRIKFDYDLVGLNYLFSEFEYICAKACMEANEQNLIILTDMNMVDKTKCLYSKYGNAQKI